eukprot:8303663-Alexandrium_andersonii.AAC.1
MTGWSTGIPSLPRLWSAGIRVRINPLNCSTAFSSDPSACGSWTAGLSKTTWGVAEPLAFA